MGKKKTKHVVVNYFPCPTRSLHSLSPCLSSAPSDVDVNVDVDVRSSKNSSSDDEFIESSDSSSRSWSRSSLWSDLSDDDDDDVRPSKMRKLSGIEKEKKKGLSSHEFTDSESSSSSSSDCYSSADEDEDEDENYYIRPDVNMMIKGEKVDLISYLSSKSRDFLVDKSGRKVSVKSGIQGKYVILICLELPVRSCSFEGEMCWALRSACSTSSIWSTNVQVVLVPIVSPEKEHEEAFASFLSGLPSCLAIPLWDSNLFARHCHFNPRTVIFDPNHTVLQNAICCFDIMRYGADSYPFTDEHFITLDKTNRGLLQEKPFPLERLLGLDLSDCLSNVAGDAKITVSQLKQKLTGVYVAFHFRIFDAVHRAYQDCLAKGRELEIVLVCVNLDDDPQHYMDSVYAALRDYNDKGKGKGILSSWWVLPYNDSTQRRLWMLVDYLCVGDDECIEELIIVGPQGEYIDPLTHCAISYDPSIHDMYPYAIHPVARQETARLQRLTLESLFEDSLLVTQQGNLMPVTDLQGKNVLLFIADFEEGYRRIMDRMRDYWCPEIKLKCKASNTALVFVPLHASGLIFTQDLDPKMFWLWDPTISWLISPPNHAREALIVKALSLKGPMRLHRLSCVAFGEDGGFVSNNLYNLSEFMANDLPPDHLYNNVLEHFCRIFNKDIRERSMVGY